MRRIAYKELRDIVKNENGTMEYHSGGAGGGGTWEIQFRGNYARIKSTQLNNADGYTAAHRHAVLRHKIAADVNHLGCMGRH